MAEKKRILVADDEDQLRGLTATVIRMMGYETLEACDGIEALEKLRQERVNGVLSDCDMPRMNGPDLSLVVQEEFKGIPIILSSATASERHQEFAREKGIPYLEKGTYNYVAELKKIVKETFGQPELPEQP